MTAKPWPEAEPAIAMPRVRDQGEGFPVSLIFYSEIGRWVVHALNEAGCNCTLVDLLDLLSWLRENRDKLPEEIRRELP